MRTLETNSIAAQLTQTLSRPGQHLAGVSHVAIEAMRLAEDPNATGVDLTRVIESDPALSARLLRVANSAFYGARKPMSSVNASVQLLGFSAVKNIAVAASLTRAFRARSSFGSFDPHMMWTHSVAVGVASRLIALRSRRVDPNDAFLAGLLHDVGVIVEMQLAETHFRSTIVALDSDPSLTFRAAEQNNIGATHETFGEALCVAWNFPVALRQVCAFHHAPAKAAPSSQLLTSIVHASDIIAAHAMLGYARTVELPTISRELQDVIGLTADDLAAVEFALPQELASALPSFNGA